MPAHLGELLRALVLGKKNNIPAERRLRLHRHRAHRGRDIADCRDGARHHRPPVPGVGGASGYVMLAGAARAAGADRGGQALRGRARSAGAVGSRPLPVRLGGGSRRLAATFLAGHRAARGPDALPDRRWAVDRHLGSATRRSTTPASRPSISSRPTIWRGTWGWWCSCSPRSASSSPPPRATSAPTTTSARSRWLMFAVPASRSPVLRDRRPRHQRGAGDPARAGSAPISKGCRSTAPASRPKRRHKAAGSSRSGAGGILSFKLKQSRPALKKAGRDCFKPVRRATRCGGVRNPGNPPSPAG